MNVKKKISILIIFQSALLLIMELLITGQRQKRFWSI